MRCCSTLWYGTSSPHAKQRDIALAWLTRSVAYALVPILALPIGTAIVGRDTSVVGDYVWRAVLLGGVVVLLSASLLRSREYAADLRAARWQQDPGAIAAVVSAARPRPASGWRRPLARHPLPTNGSQSWGLPGCSSARGSWTVWSARSLGD